MGEKQLSGQTTVVTGANSGIGKSVAIALGAAGANVIVNYVTDPDAAGIVVDKIKSFGSNATSIKADVSKEEQVVSMFCQATEQFETVDILVNNAGLQRDAKFHEMTLQQWQLVIDVNLTGQFLVSTNLHGKLLKHTMT